ncbi:MAG: D-alanyl-D-alanine carboxypeptidase [Thermoleophilia bacterium]|nr:D-alanyl-D-alanine carboxypeptidase [Thermoleophilia bacterium]
MTRRFARRTATPLILLFVLFVLLGSLLPANPAAAAASTGQPPEIGGVSAILVDMDDGRVIYEKNADERRSTASTTKIMTGILSLETLPMDRMVTASKKAADVGESEIWLEPGESLSVSDLLYALLVRSANDAAVALAEASAGSLEGFVQKMNEKAISLGLKNTHYANPHGLEAKEHYSSARDLAALARYAMRNEEFRRLVSTVTATIPWPGHEYKRTLHNRNDLVGETPFITGIKTGYTGKAGYCLVGSGARDGVSLISVILGEPTKESVDDDTVKLLEYGFAKYQRVVLTDKDLPVAEVDVPYHFSGKLPLLTDRRLVRTVYADDPVEQTVTVVDQLELPVEKGQTLGKVVYTVGGRPAGEVELVAGTAVEKATLAVKLRFLWDRFKYWLSTNV